MGTSSTILLIDDDREIVFGTSLRLRAAGYQTLAAHDGDEGCKAAVRHRPEAIVLDVRMPRLDGLAALVWLRNCADTKEIPIIMVSASLIDQQAALDSGARFFLAKPYHAKTLLVALSEAMHQALGTRVPQNLINDPARR
jgi:DNA-binding response OmpR family regulator